MSNELDGVKDDGPGAAAPSADQAREAIGPVVARSADATESAADAGAAESSLSGPGSGESADDESSDELSEVGDGSSNGVRESALVGANSAGSARAAARRSGVRSGSTPVKGAATRQRDVLTDTRGSIFARLMRFLREVVAELRKVIWPARNQMITYTIVVIVFVVFMVALVAGLDVLFAKGVLSVFG